MKQSFETINRDHAEGIIEGILMVLKNNSQCAGYPLTEKMKARAIRKLLTPLWEKDLIDYWLEYYSIRD